MILIEILILKRGHLELFIFSGVVEGRASEFVEEDAGAFGEEPPDDVDMAPAGGKMERCGTVAIFGVDVDSFGCDLHRPSQVDNGMKTDHHHHRHLIRAGNRCWAHGQQSQRLAQMTQQQTE